MVFSSVNHFLFTFHQTPQTIILFLFICFFIFYYIFSWFFWLILSTHRQRLCTFFITITSQHHHHQHWRPDIWHFNLPKAMTSINITRMFRGKIRSNTCRIILLTSLVWLIIDFIILAHYSKCITKDGWRCKNQEDDFNYAVRITCFSLF